VSRPDDDPACANPDDEAATALRPSKRVTRKGNAFMVEVALGPEKGQRLFVDEGRATRALVGKSPACDLVLTDPQVSRRHLALGVVGDDLRMTDLDSTNGTLLHGTRVHEASLRGGEVLELGGTTLCVSRHEGTVELPTATSFGRVVGASLAMRRLYPLCERLAKSSVPILIEGETGTGKELLAEALHQASERSGGPFILFDCTAIPSNLVESELFGHERGAFTTAVSSRKGLFEQAHGGTLFIDEIGDLDLSLQPKLLRAIQESRIKRVGGDKWTQVDVRILAATRRDLDKEVQSERFRDDLFFRLVVGRIELPPLRERKGDVALLANLFWKSLGGAGALPYEVLRRAEEYAWPGNVRELQNDVARAVAVGDLAKTEPPPDPSGARDLDFIDRVIEQDLPLPRAREKVIDEFLRRYVEGVVKKHGGSISRAAEASGIGQRYFQMIRARQAKKGD
jgi:two-component system response regulator HydG